MGLPLVPMTVSWPADTKLFVRGTTATRKGHSGPLRRRRPSPTKRSLMPIMRVNRQGRLRTLAATVQAGTVSTGTVVALRG